ncbi:MAG: hypothetical protein RBS17_08745 [Coriobacteriia bacterium]|nr:hypothetical protein [Coriobacteriia bacterium]
MAPISHTPSGAVFVGDLDSAADLVETFSLASGCGGYSRDDDDECYVSGDELTCFNCRGRRWVSEGFTCMKGLLSE